MAMNNIRNRIVLFLAIMGPGIITAFADNDAGGITTYAAAGAKYGYQLLFTMFVATVALAIAQEISARTGAVTGRGLADLIRELYGVKWTLFAMSVLLIANIGTTISEFSGIATSLDIFGVSKYISLIFRTLM
ncbi:MAG TPA: divalent metal cation transporter [Methylomusa anaerophila]|uniref:Divalent metal cation transporter MntH n=1 Tax=Methylomusa anaerophila TaxID=1930071 RepID=A0A348AH40_9FIRM|nr:divalent metal cation transporter [Methylomusa anaerophila]BBB90388.1 divalent metal cation transporter MntH [Methylomusa anaerophila]HML89265.1 divalent metal cation transporter [Methylomusa anaerophila]